MRPAPSSKSAPLTLIVDPGGSSDPGQRDPPYDSPVIGSDLTAILPTGDSAIDADRP